MRPDVFLDQYRITGADDSAPREIARNGPAVSYRASDLKSGAPVALTLIPINSVDPAERERFEEKARTAMLLDHLNIARTVAFGTAGDSFVYVSEYPSGETLQSWVKSNGPMPPDAVLRVGLQVVAAVAAASFHGLTHPAIQPSNLIIVPGKTTEGGWPFVKLTHFALAGLKSAPGHADPDVSASDFASPEQMLQGKADFRSEIYSLGATMCYLLTGMFYSAYPRSPQTRRFARPLRHLIARTLEDDPDMRPQDPVLFTEDLRNCLVAVERRQTLQQRFGIPFRPIVARPPRLKIRRRKAQPTPLLASIGPTPTTPVAEVVPTRSRWRPALAIAACLLVIGLISALFLPADIVTTALHRNKSSKDVGIPVGVPDAALVNAGPNPSAAAMLPPNQQPGNRGLVTTTVTTPTKGSSATASASPAAVTVPSAAAGAAVVAQQPNVLPPSQSPHSDAAASSTTAAAPSPITPAANNMQAGTSNSGQQPADNEGSSAAAAPTAAISTTTPAVESAPASVAANNAVSEPAPPAESSNDAKSEPPLMPPETDQGGAANNEDTRDTESVGPRSAPRKASSSTARTRRAAIKKSESLAQSRTHTRARRAVAAESDTARAHPGTIRARVLSITPNGNVVLVLPSGERAIVAPQDADHYSRNETIHRRPRRVIIEQRTIPAPAEYPPPYQPFIPSE
ncbi:MAG: serine/threonine protein kinase [Chthoniobacterales bacterium]